MDNEPYKVPYSALKEFLKEFGINPNDFEMLSRDKVRGWFPDLPEREPLISVDRLTYVLWEEGEEGDEYEK